jgi:hypothetical protein
MAAHPWLSPSTALVAKVVRARVVALLRKLPAVRAEWLGAYARSWQALQVALPALLRADKERVFAAVARVDVLPALLDLTDGPIEAVRLERALVTFWLGIAGHPALTSPLALSGPFRVRVVDPSVPRVLVLGDSRGLAATAREPVVIGRGGRSSLDPFAVAALPVADGTVIVDAHLNPPDADVAARAQASLAAVRAALPAGNLERLTIGTGDAALGDARVGPDADPADLIASAHAAFVRAAAALEPVVGLDGVLIDQGRRLTPSDILARACGNTVALPWRPDRAEAARVIVDDLDELAVLADPTSATSGLVSAIRAVTGAVSRARRRALLVNPDADDFVYSFQFGRSVERRCAERGLRLDRIVIHPGRHRDLPAELGGPVPPSVADGIEFFVDNERDPSVAAALRRLGGRHYDVLVANVRPRLFYDLVEGGFFAAPVLLWDRHLHGGLREEGVRRGFDARRLGGPRIRAWSLANQVGEGIHGQLADAGLRHGSGHAWPIDLEFFRSRVTSETGRLFAGGDNGRDWALLMQAIRDLPIAVHLATAHAPAEHPPNVRIDRRLPLWRFRDAIAAASIMALPLLPGVYAGMTVLPMAMALGVPVVATHTPWIEQYVTNGEEAVLVPPGDVAAFRAAIARLLEESELRERLAAKGRQRVSALCDLEQFTREMFAALD